MTTIEEFVTLVRDELGLPVTAGDLGRQLDELPGWDSVHLLSLAALLERETGRTLPMADLFEAPTLERMYGLVAASA
jgi:acyl carrier protein